MTMRRLTPRGPVSRANKIAAARVFIAASAKSGKPVPEWIRDLADQEVSGARPAHATPRTE